MITNILWIEVPRNIFLNVTGFLETEIKIFGMMKLWCSSANRIDSEFILILFKNFHSCQAYNLVQEQQIDQDQSII